MSLIDSNPKGEPYCTYAGRWLEITWSDGVVSVLPHRLLREACRCAQCVAAEKAAAMKIAEQWELQDAVSKFKEQP